MASGIFTLSDLLWYHPYPDESLGLETWKLVVSGQGAPQDANLANYGYFTGGKIVNGSDVSFTERISYSTETIRYLASAPTNITRSGSTKANFRSYAYIFGGDYSWMSNGTPGKYLTTIEKLDFTTETVSVQSGNLYQGFSHGAGVCDGIEDQYTSFYVAGGERLDASGNNQVDNFVYRWESTTNTMVKYAAYSAIDSEVNVPYIGPASRTLSEYEKQHSRYKAEATYNPNGGLGGLNTWPTELNEFTCPPTADYATYGYGHNASVPFANSSWFIYWPNKPWFNQELIETRTFLSGGNAGKFGFFAGGLTTRDYWYGGTNTTFTNQTSYQIDFLDFVTGTVFRLPYTYQQWLDIHGACMPSHNTTPSYTSYLWLHCHTQYFRVGPATTSWPSEGEHWISQTALNAYYNFDVGNDFCSFQQCMWSDMFSGWIDSPVRTYHLDKEEIVDYNGDYVGSDGTLDYPTAVPGYHYAAIYGGSNVSKIKNKTLTITSDRTATYINRVRKTAVGAAVASFIAGGSSNGKLVEKANLSTDTVSTSTTQLLTERELMVGSGYLNRDLYQTANYTDINLTSDDWLGYDFATFLTNTPVKQTNALFGGLVETIANTPAPAPGYALIAGGHIATLSMGFWYSGPDHGEYLYSVNSCTTDSQKWNFSTGGFSLSTTSALTQGRCNLGGSGNSTHGYYYGGTTIDVLYPYADVDGFTQPEGMPIQNTIGNNYSVTTVEKVSYTIESSSLAPQASGSSLNRSNIVGLGDQQAAWWLGGGVTTTTNYYASDSGGTNFGPRPRRTGEKFGGVQYSQYLVQYSRFTNDLITEVTLYSTDTTYNISQLPNGDVLGIGHGARGFGTQTFGIVMGGSAQLSIDGIWHELRTQADELLGLVVYYSSYTYVNITTLGPLQLNTGRIGHSVASTSTHGYVSGGRIYANCYNAATPYTGLLSFDVVYSTEKIDYSTSTVTTLTANNTSVRNRTMGQSINNESQAIFSGGKTTSLFSSTSYQSRTEKLTFSTDTYSTYFSSGNMVTDVQNAASLSPRANGLPTTAANTVSYSPQSAGTWFNQTGWY